jgi:hypothetical protein
MYYYPFASSRAATLLPCGRLAIGLRPDAAQIAGRPANLPPPVEWNLARIYVQAHISQLLLRWGAREKAALRNHRVVSAAELPALHRSLIE